MNKLRLETFSDGVFAIVITLLILDIRLPNIDYSQLSGALHSILPKIISYVISFTIIGVYWVGNHYYFRFIKKINGIFIWLNIFMLMLIGFLPFPTSLLGQFPFRTIPVLFYGINLVAINVVSTLAVLYAAKHKDMIEESFTAARIQTYWRGFLFVDLIYIAAITISPFAPKISYLIYILVLAGLVILYARRD